MRSASTEGRVVRQGENGRWVVAFRDGNREREVLAALALPPSIMVKPRDGVLLKLHGATATITALVSRTDRSVIPDDRTRTSPSMTNRKSLRDVPHGD